VVLAYWCNWNDYTPLAMMDFYPAPPDRLETPTASPSYRDSMSPRPAVPVLESPPRHMELRTDQTADKIMEDTGQERISLLETMPVATMRHSTSQSGAAKTNIGSRSSDTSSSAEDSTEDEVMYLGTQNRIQGQMTHIQCQTWKKKVQ
jgi:hypothetical protein